MRFEDWDVWGIKQALKGMRNPMNSWEKIDSGKDKDGKFVIGNNDLALAQRLIKSGSEHRKFMRQIMLVVDITAPIYWWKEFDTYKVGTVANSTSTMHKLVNTPITLDCFELDDYCKDIEITGKENSNNDEGTNVICVKDNVESLIAFLEQLRLKYLETKDIRYWKELIRWLPESWLQKRTVTMNFENLLNMYNQRKNHKLSEWHTFCNWIKDSVPYAKELICFQTKEEKKEIERKLKTEPKELTKFEIMIQNFAWDFTYARKTYYKLGSFFSDSRLNKEKLYKDMDLLEELSNLLDKGKVKIVEVEDSSK